MFRDKNYTKTIKDLEDARVKWWRDSKVEYLRGEYEMFFNLYIG